MTRLKRRDLLFLADRSRTTPMHNATLEIFDPAESGFDYTRLVELIDDRIAFVPRYRQRIQEVPGRLANPIWVDDDRFDLAFHVRRSGLPRPGTMEQLRELTARIMSRPLDTARPLWEIYFIEGLAEGRVAVLSKSHQILVDGVRTVDIGQVLLDTKPEPKQLEHDDWQPRRAPSPLRMTAGAVRDNLLSPTTLFATGQSAFDGAVRRAAGAQRRAGAVANALANRRPTPESPISAELSEQRRLVTVRTDLEDYRRIRDEHGTSVNDVILATLTGALRNWLMARGTSSTAMRSLRAMVPMSVIDEGLEATSLGTQIAGHLVTLPVGEPSPVIRLHQVAYAFKSHKETGTAVAANRLAGIAGFAPTTFHALGSRVAAEHQRKGFHLTITNVPGPQFPLYAAGAPMVETYPVQPLLPGQALAIGVTSYDGKVFYGITADRDALPDVTVLGQCVTESLDELLDTASGARPKAPRGRRGTGRKK
ncbi:wax ester/triacylglycerol synthase family O-acyltransferase [Nocardioides sp. AE5]|uniref:WS/DGAT/MGAT family O-acyltransferase n=1 Tax=Nocardioides sp. AE5 TaxID=2962573 RepID=UPI002881622A|nr:wax ester/triacylglycerol synthase family O-acyltransferase [Nocardioides sp. AE5]MDT0201882.1 wax ester/triacylglycerol synthase family O-acyltransferase [Nocardioides sp. AE5]